VPPAGCQRGAEEVGLPDLEVLAEGDKIRLGGVVQPGGSV
jgi:hypothetical protein